MIYTSKAEFRDRKNIAHFFDNFGIGVGNTFFATLTFSSNVTDKLEASKSWNFLKTWLFQNGFKFDYILVWERQKRGAWHLHIVGANYSRSLSALRLALSECKRRTHTPFGFSKICWTRGNCLMRVVNYLCKYLIKTEFREKGVRYVSYSRTCPRVCRLPFLWHNDRTLRYLHARSEFSQNLGKWFWLFWDNSDFSTRNFAIDCALAPFPADALTDIIIPWYQKHAKNLLYLFYSFIDDKKPVSHFDERFFYEKGHICGSYINRKTSYFVRGGDYV